MIGIAVKLLEAIGDISDGFVEEAGNTYYRRGKFEKTLKYGTIGLVASFSFAAAVWVYQANKSRRKTAV